jgi:hypothetical protein
MLLSLAAAATMDPAPKQLPRILSDVTNNPLKLVESRDPHREKQVRRRIGQIYLAGDDDLNQTRERDKSWSVAGAGGGLHTERTEG